MGLFDFVKKQLLKVIKWDDNAHNLMVYRYPMTDRDEIMNGCQLIVQESQVAMLVSNGQIADVYGPGEHKLTTGNMPILTKLASWKYGFDSPFKADVYYVNTKQFPNQKWGTQSKITMRDRDFGVVRVGARGTFAFKVVDPAQFMREIFGTNKSYETESLIEYFKSMVVSHFADVLGTCNIPIMDIAAQYDDISEALKQSLISDFDKLGLGIVALYVEAIVLPDAVNEAIDKRGTVGVMGDVVGTYAQLQAADAMRDAANNPNGMAGMGVGLGAGVAMGQNFANNLQQAQNNQPSNNQPAPKTITCPKCNQQVPEGSKFCPNCGSEMPQKRFCTNCGKEIPAGAKFCSNCGNKVE